MATHSVTRGASVFSGADSEAEAREIAEAVVTAHEGEEWCAIYPFPPREYRRIWFAAGYVPTCVDVYRRGPAGTFTIDGAE